LEKSRRGPDGKPMNPAMAGKVKIKDIAVYFRKVLTRMRVGAIFKNILRLHGTRL
jgi:hypothetical protein